MEPRSQHSVVNVTGTTGHSLPIDSSTSAPLQSRNNIGWNCVADTILYFRAIQSPSGGKHINATLQDNVLLPSDVAEHIYHVRSSHVTRSIIQSGLIPGGKDVKKGRHAVFFTAVNPMFIDLHRERDYDVAKPTIAVVY